MGLNLGSVSIAFKADTGDFEKGADTVEKRTSGLGTGLGKAMSAIGGAALTQQVVGFFSSAVEGASDLSESANKVGVVFGDSAGEVQAFADTAATALGMSEQQALEATGTFGNLMVSLGLTSGQSADMSTSLVTLASDLASFNNVDPTVALEALRSGLTGETEPLKKFGVNLNDATLKAKAMELGLSDGKGVLDANAKAQAAYALILEQTGTAQGDFARTSDGLANTQRTIKAQVADLAATLGSALMPAVSTVVGWISQLASWFSNLSPGMQQVIGIVGGVVAGLAGLALVVAPLLTVLPLLGAAFTIATGPIGLIVAAIAAVIAAGVLLYTHWDEVKAFAISTWEAIKGALETAWNAIKEAFDTAWGAIQTAWEAMWTWVSGLPAAIIGVFADAGTWLLEHGKALIQGLWDGITEIWALVTEWFGKVYGWVTDVFSDAINWLVDHGGNIISGLWNGIKDIWESVSGWLSEVYGKVMGFFSDALSWLKQKGEDIISGLWDGNKSVWENVTAWFSGMGESIKGLLDGAGEWLKGIGRSIMNGLLSGLKAAWTEVSNWVSGLGQKIKNLKGPIEKDRVLLTAEGEAIIHGLAVGMSAAWPEVERTLGVMNTRLSGGFDGQLQAAAYGSSSTTNNNQRTIAINVSGNDGLTVGRQIAAVLAGV